MTVGRALEILVLLVDLQDDFLLTKLNNLHLISVFLRLFDLFNPENLKNKELCTEYLDKKEKIVVEIVS